LTVEETWPVYDIPLPRWQFSAWKVGKIFSSNARISMFIASILLVLCKRYDFIFVCTDKIRKIRLDLYNFGMLFLDFLVIN